MRLVEPSVKLIARPSIDAAAMLEYLEEVGGADWHNRIFKDHHHTDAQVLVEFMGRLCYRSWAPGLNANVTKVREDSAVYLRNILESAHGSVLEHANFSFVISNVSRVWTHEDVRHRQGTAFSQESMRYVRLTDIPFWFPEWCQTDEDFMEKAHTLLTHMEWFQEWMVEHFDVDAKPFNDKKKITSFMRRFAPEGVATTMGMSMNIRAARFIIEKRTDEHAEEEMILVFDKIAKILVEEAPLLFGDYERSEDGNWTTPFLKV